MKKLLKRNEVEEKDKWKIEDLFTNEEAFLKEFERVKGCLPKIRERKGHLGDSGKVLFYYLKQQEEIDMAMERLSVYANQRYHEDTGNNQYQNYSDMTEKLMVSIEGASAYGVPEILSIPNERLESFLEEEKELNRYRRFLEKIRRRKEHILSADLEKLLADAKEMANAPGNIFSMFNNADIKFPSIVDEKGEESMITHGRYLTFLQSPDRRVRREAFIGLYSTYSKFKNTLASLYGANVNQKIFYSRARNYPSTLEMVLYENEIPTSVYFNLIEQVHNSLPFMHRYMALRKKALKVDDLHMYDLYAPIVEDIELKIPFEKAKQMVINGLAPLGEEYGKILKEGLSSGWIDVYENEGKRSGAYSWGAYGTHPYVLLNYQETLNHVFTLAHEMGHAIHSYYSDKNQPYVYAGYKIFVAEVASTCNEALLLNELLKNTTNKRMRAYLLNYQLEQFQTTFFRQTMFAEFEKITYQMAEKGETLTEECLCRVYRELNQLYFGKNVVIDEEIAMEWARIPHFYTPFYVYQYATGFSAAIALSRQILEEGEPAIKRYINEFLKEGSRKNPIELLIGAGVDMRSKEPVFHALKVFEERMDELEEMLMVL